MTDPVQDHPRRRKEDRARFPRLTAAAERIAKCGRKTAWVWPALSSVVSLVAVIAAVSAVEAQKDGRRIASTATCVAIGAITKAGQAAVAKSATPIRGAYAENLRRLGAPTQKQREAAAMAARVEYGRTIARDIEQRTGIPGIARPDGTIDCARLRQVTIEEPKS